MYHISYTLNKTKCFVSYFISLGSKPFGFFSKNKNIFFYVWMEKAISSHAYASLHKLCPLGLRVF